MWDKMVVEADLTGECPGGGISSSYKIKQRKRRLSNTPNTLSFYPNLPLPFLPFLQNTPSHSKLHPRPPGKTLPPPPPPQPSTRPPQALKRLNPHLCVIRRALVFNQEIVAEPAPGLGLDLADLRVKRLSLEGGVRRLVCVGGGGWWDGGEGGG